MKKAKRLLALLLSVAMLIMVFAGCVLQADADVSFTITDSNGKGTASINFYVANSADGADIPAKNLKTYADDGITEITDVTQEYEGLAAWIQNYAQTKGVESATAVLQNGTTDRYFRNGNNGYAKYSSNTITLTFSFDYLDMLKEQLAALKGSALTDGSVSGSYAEGSYTFSISLNEVQLVLNGMNTALKADTDYYTDSDDQSWDVFGLSGGEETAKTDNIASVVSATVGSATSSEYLLDENNTAILTVTGAVEEASESEEQLNAAKQILINAVTVAQGYVEADYSTDTWSAFETALTSANNLVANGADKSAAYTSAADTLNAARKALVYVAPTEGNIAHDYGTAYDNEARNNYSSDNTELSLNDGSENSTWQYESNDTTDMYAGIEFPVSAQVTQIAFVTTGIATDGGWHDYVLSGKYTISYYNGEEWINVSAVESSNALVCNFAEPTKISNIKITFTAAATFAPKLKEIYVIGTSLALDIAKKELNATLAAAALLESDAYTSDSWATLSSAVAAGNSLISSDSSDVNAILSASQSINTAIADLKTNLEVSVENASQYNSVYYKYDESAYLTVRSLVLSATELLKSGTTDAATLNALAAAIDDAVATMLTTTGNIAPKGTPSAESYYGDGKEVENVNNGDNTDRWQSNTAVKDGASTWVMLDFGSATAMNQFEICWEINRAGSDNYVIQYSDDGTSWTNAQNVTISSFNQVAKPNSSDYYYYQSASFDTFEARYVRLYITGVADNSKTQPSIYEWEIYYNALADFGAYGAQIRTNANDPSAHDLRFRSNISEMYYTTNVLTIESVGTLIARADQLKNDELTIELVDTANYYIADLRAVYFNNNDTATTGNYVFTSTILNISDIDRNYVARSYIRFSDGSVIYSDQIMRCVRDGL